LRVSANPFEIVRRARQFQFDKHRSEASVRRHAADVGARVQRRPIAALHDQPAVVGRIAVQAGDAVFAVGYRRLGRWRDADAAGRIAVPDAAGFPGRAPPAGRGGQSFDSVVLGERKIRDPHRPRPRRQSVKLAVVPDAVIALEADQQIARGGEGQPLGVAVDLFGDRGAVGQCQPPRLKAVQPDQSSRAIQPQSRPHQVAHVRHRDQAAVAGQLQV